jgi:hypothetical protein
MRNRTREDIKEVWWRMKEKATENKTPRPVAFELTALAQSGSLSRRRFALSQEWTAPG